VAEVGNRYGQLAGGFLMGHRLFDTHFGGSFGGVSTAILGEISSAQNISSTVIGYNSWFANGYGFGYFMPEEGPKQLWDLGGVFPEGIIWLRAPTCFIWKKMGHIDLDTNHCSGFHWTLAELNCAKNFVSLFHTLDV